MLLELVDERQDVDPGHGDDQAIWDGRRGGTAAVDATGSSAVVDAQGQSEMVIKNGWKGSTGLFHSLGDAVAAASLRWTTCMLRVGNHIMKTKNRKQTAKKFRIMPAWSENWDVRIRRYGAWT